MAIDTEFEEFILSKNEELHFILLTKENSFNKSFLYSLKYFSDSK